MKNISRNFFRKILVVCPTLNLDHPYGATPAVWQLLKALYELNCELIITPYRGRAIRSLWWRCYDNPCRVESALYAAFKKYFGSSNGGENGSENISDGEGLTPKLARYLTLPRWKRHLKNILTKESDVEAVIFIQIPLNQIRGIADSIKREFGIPVFYYEVDVPTSLPEYRGFSFNHFINADLSEFDAFIIPSEGSKKRLLEMGARKVHILHFGVDPDVYLPIETDQMIDVFFSGNGSRNREKSILELVSKPSREIEADFVVSGRGYDIDLGNARNIPQVPFSSWRIYCCSSRINLNIPRENHALTYATSTSRPFELAAMKCCIISSRYLGLDKWFDLKNEILVAENSDEAVELYKWLLSNEETRLEMAERAYKRVMKDHTFQMRGKELLKIIDSFTK